MRSESPALEGGRYRAEDSRLKLSQLLSNLILCYAHNLRLSKLSQKLFGCSLPLVNEPTYLPKKLRHRRTIARHKRSPSPAPRLRTRRGGHTPRALGNAQQRSSSIASIESERRTQRPQASSEQTASNRDDRRGLVRAVRTMHRIN